MAATTRAKRKPAEPTVVPADFEAPVGWITTERLVEREVEMRLVLRVSLAGGNVWFVGGAGIAKSLGVREFARCITGARYWEKQLHPSMSPDSILGAPDIPKLTNEGIFTRKHLGTLTDSHFGFADELTRLNGPSFDALLPVANSQERQAENDTGMMSIPLRAFFCASNHTLPENDPQYGAIEDRLTVIKWVEDIQTDENFKELLRRDHNHRVSETAGSGKRVTLSPRPTITLEQFDEAQRQVRLVTLGGSFLDAIAELRRKAKAAGLHASPRRWVEIAMLCRANAWLAGRNETAPEDLAIAEFCLARQEHQRGPAADVVLDYKGRFTKEAQKLRRECSDGFETLEKIRPQVEGAPTDQALPREVMLEAISLGQRFDANRQRVTKVLDEARAEKAEAAEVEELANELTAALKWMKGRRVLAPGIDV